MKKKATKPYHIFKYNGNTYMLNIKDMSAFIIDEMTSSTIERLGTDPNIQLDHNMEANIKKLRLLSEMEAQTPHMNKRMPPPPINYITIFLTQTCNLRCVYCYGDGGEYGTGGSMDKKTAFQAVDWLIEQSGKMRNVHISFFGGEPFLQFPLMRAIVEYSKKKAMERDKKIRFSATSNATLFDDEIISFIKEEDISVMVSFDGPKEIQDFQRPYANGKGSYSDTVPKIKKLLASVPETAAHAVIMGDTDPQLVKNALQEIGFTKNSIVPASQSLFSKQAAKTNSERDTQNLLRQLEKEATAWIHSIHDRDIFALKNLKNKGVLYQSLSLLLHNSIRLYPCSAGRNMVAVSVAGDVYLCHRFVGQDQYKLGNVFEHKVNREEYLKSPSLTNTTCSSCFARYYCAGGCKYDNTSCCGSITAPAEDMCRIRKRELEMSTYVISNLSPEEESFLVEKEIFFPKPCLLDF